MSVYIIIPLYDESKQAEYACTSSIFLFVIDSHVLLQLTDTKLPSDPPHSYPL